MIFGYMFSNRVKNWISIRLGSISFLAAITLWVPSIQPVAAQAPAANSTAVPYYSQLDNRFEPKATCSTTSMAMITDYLGMTNQAAQSLPTPDFIYQKFGKLQMVDSFSKGFNALAIQANSAWRDDATEQGTIDELRARAAAGIPSVIPGWFTPSGHILVVLGFDGESYIVHDPYGRWDQHKWGSYDTSISGAYLHYEKSAFEYAINDNGQGDDLWLHRFKQVEQ